MADVAIPSIATVTPASGDTVLGVQGGAVKRFSVSTFPYLSNQGGTLQRLRDAADGLSQAVDYRHRGTSGYVFHGVTEAGSGGFLDAKGTDEGGAGAQLYSHKNSAAAVHAIQHGGASMLNYWQGYSVSSVLHAEVYKGNQGIKVVAKNGSGFGDGVTTSGSTTFTSATAAFTVADVGASISQTTNRGSVAPSGCIPSGTTIAAYVSATQVTLSQAATTSGTSIPFLVGSRAPDATQPLLTFYDDDGTTVRAQIRRQGFDFYGSGSTATAAVSMTSAGIFAARFGSSLSNVGATSSNVLTLTSGDSTGTGSHLIYGKGGSAMSGDFLHLEASGSTAILSRINKGGYYMTRKSAAPVLSDMADGETALWVDAATGDVKFTSRISGALKTGTVVVA